MRIKDVIALLDTEREQVLVEWQQDPDCPHVEHDSKDCKGKCDGYCIAYNILARVAHKLEHPSPSMEIKAL